MRHLFIRIILPVLVLLAGGALLAEWLMAQAAREMRADMVQRVQLLAQGINPRNLRALEGTAADEAKPEYRRLKQQLRVVRSVYPGCRFIYLAGRKADGSIYFFMDSEPAGTKDFSPPGQPYPEGSDAFRRVFDTKLATTEGPMPDRWGVWVSALVPITDPLTGDLLAVAGMDVDAREWKGMLARAALPAALLALALATIWVLGAVLLDRRARLETGAPGWMRHIEPGLVISLGLTLGIAGAWLTYTTVSRHQDEMFGKLAEHEAGAIVERLQNVRDIQLEGLAHFYTARDHITTGEFQEFAQSLTRTPSITVWGWAPVVPAAERERFEARARLGEFPEFEIWEVSPEGKRKPAGRRETYFPVLQIAPGSQARVLAGGDLGGEPRRRTAVEEASATGLTSGSEPVIQLTEAGQQKGMVILRPVYTRDLPRRLRGFVGASVRMESLVRAGAAPDRLPLVELILLREGAAPESLATTWPPDAPPQAGRSATRPVFAFGKVFLVTVRAGPEFGRKDPLQAGGLALLSGLLLTGTLATLVRFILRRREKLEQLVAERTAELRLSEESYRNQFANSSAVMVLIDPADGMIVDANTAALGFYGFARERLLAMNITEININPPAEIRRFLDEVAAGRRHRFETQHRLAGGEVRDVAVASSGIQYLGRTILHSIIQDITEQKRAQEALRESAERYRSIISVSNTGAWEYYADTGDFWASPEYFGMLGRSPANFDVSARQNLQGNWVDLLHPEDREAASARFAEYLRHGSVGMYEAYFRMRHRNGEWIWIWARGQTLRDAGGGVTNLTVGTHIDITERKKAAVELERANSNLEERIKELGCLYAISKLITESNRSVGELLAAATELIPAGWRHPEIARARISYEGRVFVSAGFKATALRQSADIMIAGEAVGTVDVCYLEGDPARAAAPFLAEEQTLLNNIAAQFGVMIERRQAEKKLRQLSSIIEQAPLSVIITNLDRVVEYVNPKFCAVTGFSREEMIGRDVRMLRSPETPPEVYGEMGSALADSRVWTGQMHSLKKNGESYLENAVAAPLVGGDGRPTHYVTLKDDITAQKRFEAETKAMLEKERELSQVKSQFISVASHEFRTPLAAAVGSLELLERHAAKLTEAKRLELLARIKTSLGRLTTIMDDVLQLSRADSGRVKVNRMNVDLVRFVQDIISQVETGDRQQHRFVFHRIGGPDTVPADTSLLHHIMSNLVGNAVRYSPAGTGITVTLEVGEKGFTFTVADEGIGIPEADRERIFEPFVRGSNVGQIGGTGLGLNIVKRYIELMGGRIELPPVARGTTFRVNIPLQQPSA